MVEIAGKIMGESFPVLEEPLKLLFVDDDPLLCEFALMHLGADCGEVSVASDGGLALSAIRLRPPDVVILDLHLPKIDGFEVLKAIRSDDATKRLPVIVITGRDDVYSINRAFSEGATSFLVKPINWRLLAYQIRYVNRAAQNELALVERVAEVEERKREVEATSAELATALRAAAAASEAKSQFLATMSHELRTPMNAILGFSEILDGQTFGPLGDLRYQEYARAIRDSGGHLLALISDVLEFSRASSGKLELDDQEFSPGEVIEEAVQIVSPQAKTGGVCLHRDATFANLRLRGDRRRVRQVLINVLGNGVKFTPAGGRVTICGRQDSHGFAIIVSDTGIGIAAENIPKALDHFAQVDSLLTRRYDGLGLGLPLAKQLVELHGGRFDIESAIDVGTTVTITFPHERVTAGLAA
jgi:signal transduction histidine kinase